MPTAIAIKKAEGKPGKVWYPLDKIDVPHKDPKQDEVTVKVLSTSLNHRDVFIRQHLYPGTTFSVPLLADASGIVTSTGSSTSAKAFLNKRVILNPGSGWLSSPHGPESPTGYKILGGTRLNPLGTLTTELTISASELELAPAHLDAAEAAALPLVGLTAWRALKTKSTYGSTPGSNILVTGIGGGVALMLLVFGVASDLNVYVTSSSAAKLEKAKALGAKGGADYTAKNWQADLLSRLPKDKPKFDAIVDGAGTSTLIANAVKLLRPGGVIVSYGMTTAPTLPFTMAAVLQNLEIRGSTMGSRQEFKEMVEFVNGKKIRPVVEKVAKGGLDDLDSIEELFEMMKAGKQFGKLVIEVSPEHGGEARKNPAEKSKL
ncbi:hypothetical protein AAFC00_002301 [Neodothiora populina]|uniref:Enoyl reductase (ER) domain-containing protein n=1 Tax=Neodothiora populina TaxID=2781224 RepID=A0ABR3PGY9_9PEZI